MLIITKHAALEKNKVADCRKNLEFMVKHGEKKKLIISETRKKKIQVVNSDRKRVC